jgi:hypothetical protein
MELEGVGTIAMCGILVKIFRKIDNLDGLKWAFLHDNQQELMPQLANNSNLSSTKDCRISSMDIPPGI